MNENKEIPVDDIEALKNICPMFRDVLEFVASKTDNFSRFLCRSDFTPNDFKDYLPHIALSEFDVSADGDVSNIFCRVSGAWVSSYYGEMSGKFIKDHVVAEINDRTVHRFQMVHDAMNAIGFKTQILSQEKEYLSIRALFIPVSDDGETHNLMLAFIENSNDAMKGCLTY